MLIFFLLYMHVFFLPGNNFSVKELNLIDTVSNSISLNLIRIVLRRGHFSIFDKHIRKSYLNNYVQTKKKTDSIQFDHLFFKNILSIINCL